MPWTVCPLAVLDDLYPITYWLRIADAIDRVIESASKSASNSTEEVRLITIFRGDSVFDVTLHPSFSRGRVCHKVRGSFRSSLPVAAAFCLLISPRPSDKVLRRHNLRVNRRRLKLFNSWAKRLIGIARRNRNNESPPNPVIWASRPTTAEWQTKSLSWHSILLDNKSNSWPKKQKAPLRTRATWDRDMKT